MVNSKKLLSLFLAVVMFVSVFTVMATAYTVGPEVAGDINVKYTVEKVDTVPETAAGSAEWTADNIYAVHVWMQCDAAVDNFTAPVHYNKAHFSPIMLSDGECTYPYGAGMDQDTYYTDMGEGAVYAYAEGDYLNNTGMYKANGTTATTKALAKCIGLGNSNSEGASITTELVSPDHPLYNKWGAGLPENTGVMYVNIDVVAVTKTAYLNTISGITHDTGWNRMFTFYFETITDEDVTGDEFGVYTDDCFTVDGTTDTYASYFTSATTSVTGNPNKNVVSNAVVEAAAEPTIVNPLKGQMRYGKVVTEEDGSTSQYYDVRALAVITGDDFNATFTDVATAKTMINEIGFVFAAGSNLAGTAPDMAGVKALVENGTALSGYAKKEVHYLSTIVDEGNYVFSCIVPDINEDDAKTNSLIAVGYIKWTDSEGTHYNYYQTAQEISFNTLYNSTNKPN